MNREAPKRELINNGNTSLNVIIHSNDKSETILLLHGGPGVPDDMLEVVNVLKTNYRVVTFEQRGTGASICQDCSYTMDEYISDIDAIMEKLDVKKFHLFGHSWGGLYAQIYASEKPHRIDSLFLCSPSSGTNESWKKTEKEVMQFNKNNASGGEWLKMGWYSLAGMLGSHNAYRKMFRLVLINYNKKYVNVEITDEYLSTIFSDPVNKTRKEIIKYKPLLVLNNPEFPILISYGDNDIYGESKRELPRRYPTAKIETIEKCGHIPWLHNLEAFKKILNEYYVKN